MDEQQLRDQKLQELREQYARQRGEEETMQRAEIQLDGLMRKMLTDDAKARLANVKLVNPEAYAKAVQAIMYLQQSGKVSGKLEDADLKALLGKLKSNREPTIKRK